MMARRGTRGLLSIGIGIALCFFVAWQQRHIAPFSPTSGMTMRGIVTEYLHLAYDEGRGADAVSRYFAKDAVDGAPGAIDRVNGPPIPHRIEKIVVDGMSAAVYHRIDATRGAPAMDVVDMYKADRFSRIVERQRVAQTVAG